MVNYLEHTTPESKVQDVAAAYGVATDNAFSLVQRALQRIEVSAFFDMVSVTGLSREELAGLLDVSFKTVQRYSKENKRLSVLNSEQLLRLVRLYALGEEVFGSVEAFDRWLRKPAIAFGGQRPFVFLQSPGGIDLVKELLHRIEHGILA